MTKQSKYRDCFASLAMTQLYILLVFLFIAFLVAAVFFADQLYQASQKPFWGDEIYGVTATARGNTFGGLLIGNARASQSSPAPLDYLLLKPLDQIASRISCLGFKAEVYYRLIANLSTTLTAFCFFLLFICSFKSDRKSGSLIFLQSLIIIFAMIAFLFSRFVHYYGAEMRPYAIWNAMYMLTLAAGILRRDSSRIFMISMILLSLSATASLFQIMFLGLSYFCIYGIHENWKTAFIKSFKIFVIPLGISLFYCLRVSKWDMVHSGSTWSDFLDLWINKATIMPLMLMVIAGALAKKETRTLAIIPLGYLLLFLAGPLIFKITQARGYFYTDRQYVYYDLGNAVFLLSLVQLIPHFISEKMPKKICVTVLIAVMVVSVSVTFRKKVSRKFVQAFQHSYQILKEPQVIQSQPGAIKLYFN